MERFYEAASAPFVTTQRKIDDREEPFTPPEFDPESDNEEPPYLEEWLEARQSLNFLGQASLCLVQSGLKEFLDGFIKESGGQLPSGQGNWFERYKEFFLKAYNIDWEKGPVPLKDLEEINLTRDDVQHGDIFFPVARYQSKTHATRFPNGLFLEQDHRPIHRDPSHVWPGPISVGSDVLREAIRRVEEFCSFIDQMSGYRSW